MANWVSRSLEGIDEDNYQITQVRGYNRSAAEYARKNAKQLREEYGSKTFIALSGRKEQVLASGDSIEDVLSTVGGLRRIQFPNARDIIVGKVRDIVSAQRKFSKHLEYLRTLSKLEQISRERILDMFENRKY
jgi:hypothetical protein